MKSRRIAFLLILLTNPVPLRAEVHWSHGVIFSVTAAPLYTIAALRTATDKFLDLPLGGGEAGPGSGSGRKLSAFRVQPGPQVGVRIDAETALATGLRLRAGGAYAVALTSVRFPKGIDVFTDPAHARLLAQDLSFDLALDWGRDWRITTGLGLDLALVQTHVTSALLDVHAVTHSAQPYALLGLSRDLPDGLCLAANLRFNKKDADLSIGILKRF